MLKTIETDPAFDFDNPFGNDPKKDTPKTESLRERPCECRSPVHRCHSNRRWRLSRVTIDGRHRERHPRHADHHSRRQPRIIDQHTDSDAVQRGITNRDRECPHHSRCPVPLLGDGFGDHEGTSDQQHQITEPKPEQRTLGPTFRLKPLNTTGHQHEQPPPRQHADRLDNEITRYNFSCIHAIDRNRKRSPRSNTDNKALIHNNSLPLIYSVGTQVVTKKDVNASNDRIAHPAGAVGVIVRSPVDRKHAYRVRFNDGFEAPIQHDQIIRLSEFKSVHANANESPLASAGLYDRVIYRCVIGSRAYGLDHDESDTDRRGVYLPPASLHWSLYGVPEQLENDETQEVYWELQKFMVLALKANPNVLECLYSPIVENVTPLGEELLAMRDVFLSKLVFQTYSGYVASQFKKMQTDIRNQGRVKWKHVMHLIRLLISGTHVLTECTVNVDAGEHRDRLLTIRCGEMPFAVADQWRNELQIQFESAFQQTRLPERPDYERVNAFLIEARRRALENELP